jgi:hypothetical protein
LISPYKAPASQLVTDAVTLGTLRWRGAVYFSFIPTLFMILMEASVIYSESKLGPIYWRLKMVEPALYCTPLCLLMAASGYAVAIRCLSRTVASTLLLGCIVGAGWTLVVVIVGNTIAQLNGATPLTL